MNKIRSLITWSNIANVLIVALGLAVLFVPAVKVFFIGLMMQVGLMRAPTEKNATNDISTVPARISFRTVTDSVFSTGQLNDKILIINFWATWCPPCRAELPSINELYHHYKNNPKVMVLAVDADGKLPAAQSFMVNNGYDLPVYTLASQLPPDLDFETVPTTIILDGKGYVVARHEGAANYASKGFYEFVDGLVKTVK